LRKDWAAQQQRLYSSLARQIYPQVPTLYSQQGAVSHIVVKRVRGTTMQSIDISDRAAELAKAERLVVMTNLLVELQRQFVEYLDQTNNDITSAKMDFDHLLAGLVSCVERRHRLRAMVRAQVMAA
jgi:hypothetical protein